MSNRYAKKTASIKMAQAKRDREASKHQTEQRPMSEAEQLAIARENDRRSERRPHHVV